MLQTSTVKGINSELLKMETNQKEGDQEEKAFSYISIKQKKERITSNDSRVESWIARS